MEALPEEQIDELIELLRQYELSIAALYDTFARLLVSDGQTWTKFANEERLHAKWISIVAYSVPPEPVWNEFWPRRNFL